MQKCELCKVEPQTSQLTRCCKNFICDLCRQKYQKTGACSCGKSINKKLCSNNPQLFQLIKLYYEGKVQQCERCDYPAEIECTNCNMIFCSKCNEEVHDGKGFAKHIRESYQKEIKSHAKLIEKVRKKQQWCKQHKQVYQSVCECGVFLCGGCVRGHKQNCNRMNKPRSYKQYRQEYFSQILFKIKQISDYKEKLQVDKNSYSKHFIGQKEIFEAYSKLLQEQLQGIRKVFELKIAQIKNRLQQYWEECTRSHNRNSYFIDCSIKKFDDLGHLAERFVEKTIGYEYLEKRVKRVYINQQFFNFKVQGLEDIQMTVMNLSAVYKNWQINTYDKNLTEIHQQKNKEKRMEPNFQVGSTSSQLFLEISSNPLNHRPLSLKSSHNQICFQFLHLPYQNQAYQIEYGVGLKMKGLEVFKKIENRNGMGFINNLNPSTKYRVRMRVNNGEWGPINEIKTLDMPKFLTQSSAIQKNNLQVPLQILKSGTIYCSNEINFGIHTWQVKIFPPKHNDEQTACVSVGISNKEQKKPIFVGTTLNYGYQKVLITVKVTLNCDQNRMTISSTGQQDEVYQNLPHFPVYPAIQNKGGNPVQIQCIFN